MWIVAVQCVSIRALLLIVLLVFIKAALIVFTAEGFPHSHWINSISAAKL